MSVLGHQRTFPNATIDPAAEEIGPPTEAGPQGTHLVFASFSVAATQRRLNTGFYRLQPTKEVTLGVSRDNKDATVGAMLANDLH
jgi:hypothetical protein